MPKRKSGFDTGALGFVIGAVWLASKFGLFGTNTHNHGVSPPDVQQLYGVNYSAAKEVARSSLATQTSNAERSTTSAPPPARPPLPQPSNARLEQEITPARLCGAKQHCTDMRTCGEAKYFHDVCRLFDLDRDNDGVPCESVCGNTIATMQSRILAEPFDPDKPTTRTATVADFDPTVEGMSFSCDGKRTCKQMNSCAEARFYLNNCSVSSLDRDRDGVPCEGLCR